MALELHALNLGPLDNNSYVLACPRARECAVVDVGFEPEAVIELVRRAGWSVRWLLGTHAHFDHAAGMLDVQRALGGVYALHPADRPLLERLPDQGPMFGFPASRPAPVGHDLAHGERIAIGDEWLDVRFTPGHSPGHVIFVRDRTALVGDVLFRESIGRTDLPGGSYPQLEHSIRTQLFTLDDDVRCLTGHGPETTIGHERRHNPFVGAAAERA